MCQLTKREVSKLSTGEIPHTMTGQPFAVIRQSVTMILSDNQSWEWDVITSPKDSDTTEIDRDTAVKIIENHKMQLAYSSRDGQVYELPEKPFLEAYDRRKKEAS